MPTCYLIRSVVVEDVDSHQNLRRIHWWSDTRSLHRLIILSADIWVNPTGVEWYFQHVIYDWEYSYIAALFWGSIWPHWNNGKGEVDIGFIESQLGVTSFEMADISTKAKRVVWQNRLMTASISVYQSQACPDSMPVKSWKIWTVVIGGVRHP